MSKQLLQDIQQMLQVMTDNGLLDELTTYMHPDDINSVCDRVDEAIEQSA